MPRPRRRWGTACSTRRRSPPGISRSGWGGLKLSVQAVARNDRDGSLSFEDGRGRAISGAGLKLEDAITRQSSWLDLADIVLGPDTPRFDVIELRVFDHPTRRLLTNLAGKVVGFDMVSPSVVQLRGLGTPLPGSVDVWFRACVHANGETPVRLDAAVGSSAPLAGGRLSIQEIRPGKLSFTRLDGPGVEHPRFAWHPSGSRPDRSCTAVFHWAGKWEEADTRSTR